MCKNFFEPLVDRIKSDGPRGSVALALAVDSWVDHTERARSGGICPHSDTKCVDCPVICAMLTDSERTRLESYM